MPPVPNEGESIKAPPLVSKEPVDIENLLKLNPKIKPFANAVPSAVTKKVNQIKALNFKYVSYDTNFALQINLMFTHQSEAGI